MDKQSAFRILGITEYDDAGEIRTRYRSLMKQYHPDVAGDDKERLRMSQMLSEAFLYLKAEGFLHSEKEERIGAFERIHQHM